MGTRENVPFVFGAWRRRLRELLTGYSVLEGDSSFDAPFYLATNPDVAAAGVDPLQHYLRFGRAEGRLPCKPKDAWRARLDSAGSALERMKRAPTPVCRSERAAVVGLTSRLAAASREVGLVISVSHDDAARHWGGVQNVVGGEQRAMSGAGWGYLHVSPASPMGTLADNQPLESTFVYLRLNGESLGVVSFDELIEMVRGLSLARRRVQLVVHHIAGHAPEHLLQLARASGDARPVFWVHDYFTICPSTFLLRNDVTFCGAPVASSPACGICCYGEQRSRHVARIRRLFAETQPMVLAPSDCALNFWLKGELSRDGAAVVPLARLVPGPAVTAAAATAPLRVAHVGAPAFHKGWHIFEELAARLAGSPGYQLFHLGAPARDAVLNPIVSVPVLVQAEDVGAMARAVSEQQIDVVLSWSLCHETFSFTTHEALAGGAFVIARAGSGNVWPAVTRNAPNQGCSLEDEGALSRLFEGGALRSLLAKAERRRFTLIAGRATADWLQ